MINQTIQFVAVEDLMNSDFLELLAEKVAEKIKAQAKHFAKQFVDLCLFGFTSQYLPELCFYH